MRRSLIDQSPIVARINVTPIIDVALVLVIILLITAPMLTVKDLGITLPEAETRGAEDELRVSISLGKHGEVAVDEDLVTLESLPFVLETRIAETKKDVLVVVRADSETSYEFVRQVLKEARAAGAQRLAIATRQGERGLS